MFRSARRASSRKLPQPSLRNRARAASLLLLLAMMPAVLFAARHKKAAAAQNAAIRPLTERERALQALNRLTFGPRPGDVDRVMAMGVDKWIDLQLDPQKIDDSALDAQLAGYPAIAMPLQDLIERYPADSLVRAVADGKRPSPVDPVERAIYNNQVADYEQRKEKKADQAAQNGGTVQTPQPAMSMQAPAMEPAAGPGMETENKPKRMAYTGPDAGEILALPPAERWNRLVAMNPEEFRSFFQGMRPQDRLQVTDGMTPQQKEVVYALVNPTQLVTGELLQTRLLTDIDSERQLQAVMTDFWLNHFNVYLRKGPLAPWYLVDYERNIVAPRAMGKFEDLLVATAQSPAMLFYLDNHASIGPDSQAAVRARMNPKNNNQDPGLNENYGRELMELHTLGVDGGYTQKDVTEVAKVFTGWTIQDGADGGQFVFNDRRHEPGPKYVLGKTIQDGGEREGMEVLHMLATSPATAHHLSQELAVRFVSDNPPPELVDRMAQTYLHTGGDIREVLRTMFHSPEFWSADAYRVKVKTPEEFVISAVRASQGEVVRPALLLNAMNKLGMSFFGCQTPNGYSWKADGWVNTGDLLDRMNLALALASNRQGTAVDLDALLKADNPGAQLVDQKETELEQAFLEEPLSDQTRSAVLNQVAAVMGPAGPARAQPLGAGMNAAKGQGKGASLERKAAMVQMIDLPEAIPPPQDNQAAALAGLLLGSPDFQKK